MLDLLQILWAGAECSHIRFDISRILHSCLHWVRIMQYQYQLRKILDHTVKLQFVSFAVCSDALGAVIGSTVYFEYGFGKIAQIASGLMFAFTIIVALILLVNWNRLRGPAHRMFPSWINSTSASLSAAGASDPAKRNYGSIR